MAPTADDFGWFKKKETQTIIIWSCCFPLYVCAPSQITVILHIYSVHSWPYCVVLLFLSCSALRLNLCDHNLTVRRRLVLRANSYWNSQICWTWIHDCWRLAPHQRQHWKSFHARFLKDFILQHIATFKCIRNAVIERLSPRLASDLIFTSLN